MTASTTGGKKRETNNKRKGKGDDNVSHSYSDERDVYENREEEGPITTLTTTATGGKIPKCRGEKWTVPVITEEKE